MTLRVEFTVIKNSDDGNDAEILFTDIYDYDSAVNRRAVAANIEHYLDKRDQSIDIIMSFVV